jgi:hypothetical protein
VTDESRLREVLQRLEPDARARLRTLLVADAAHRDHMAQNLLRTGTDAAESLADVLDMLTLDTEVRRSVVRLLGELEASA